MDITVYKLSKDICIPQTRISEIIKCNRGVSADTTLRLSKYIGNSAKFWLGLQNDFELEEEDNNKHKMLKGIVEYSSDALEIKKIIPDRFKCCQILYKF